MAVTTIRAALVDRSDDPPYRLTARGLVVERDLSSEEYDRVGRRIGQIANATNWTVGDWIVYGQANGYAGAKYSRAQQLTGMTYDVLSQAARVSEAYPLECRVDDVSWTHHRAALTLPSGERVTVLRRAATEKWTAMMVQTFVRERQRAMSVGLALSQIPSPARDAPHVKGQLAWRQNKSRRRRIRVCPKCGHRWEVQTTAAVGN